LVRRCACGKVVRLRDSICKDCRVKYGRDPEKWPDWFAFLITNEQARIDHQRNHDFCLSLELETDKFFEDLEE